jgi:hypothetical protein
MHDSEWYYQCIPGAASTTSTTFTTSTRTTTTSGYTTTITTSSTSTSKPTTTVPTTTTTTHSTGPTGTPTLSSGWYWIRAVESPNFHSYLQTKPTGSPSPAYLDTPNNAGLYNIIGGQFVYNTGAGQLYMNVEDPTDKTQRALQTFFNETQNTYGSFSFSGDAVEWTDPDVARPNLAAWYVCEDQQLYINTGPYLYQTPAGCYDETVCTRISCFE